MPTRKKKIRVTSLGLVLLETLVTVSLGLLLSAMLVREVSSLTKLQGVVETQYEYAQASLVASSYFRKLLLDYDSHPLILTPIIHSNGNIKLKNGSPHKVMSSSKLPLVGSDAISVYKVNSLHSLQLISSSSTGSIACPRYESFGLSQYKKGFIGLTANKTLELQGTWEKHKSLPSCYKMSLTSVDSVSHRKENWLTPFVKTILPIKEHYSLYLDRDGNLRYLGHYGKRIKENQPIATGIKKLKIDAVNSQEPPSYSLKFSLVTTSDKTYSESFHSSLLKQQAANFIFAVP